MANIRIGTEELEQAGTQLLNYGEELETFIGTITTLIDDTATDWNSPAADEYRNSWKDLSKTFQAGKDILDTMGQNAIETAQAHREIDLEGQKAFQVK